MKLLLEFIAAMIATISFAGLFEAPKSQYVYCGITGGIAWVIYSVFDDMELGLSMSTLISAFALTILSRVFAVINKMPITVYLIPGIFPIVPGTGIYFTAYNFVTDNMDKFREFGTNTLYASIAITFGIIFALSIPQRLFKEFGRLFELKNQENKSS